MPFAACRGIKFPARKLTAVTGNKRPKADIRSEYKKRDASMQNLRLWYGFNCPQRADWFESTASVILEMSTPEWGSDLMKQLGSWCWAVRQRFARFHVAYLRFISICPRLSTSFRFSLVLHAITLTMNDDAQRFWRGPKSVYNQIWRTRPPKR